MAILHIEIRNFLFSICSSTMELMDCYYKFLYKNIISAESAEMIELPHDACDPGY